MFAPNWKSLLPRRDRILIGSIEITPPSRMTRPNSRHWSRPTRKVWGARLRTFGEWLLTTVLGMLFATVFLWTLAVVVFRRWTS